jgi:hypothetical protein
MSIGGLQKRGEKTELLVGPVLAPGIPDAKDQDVNGRYCQQRGKHGHHQAAKV